MEIESKLKELGIDIKNSNGNYRSVYDVLTDMTNEIFISKVREMDEENKKEFCKALIGDKEKSTMESLLEVKRYENICQEQRY